MKCPACGSEQPDGAIICATCNTVFSEMTAPMQVPGQSTGTLTAEGEMLSGAEPLSAPRPEFSFAFTAEPPSVLKLAGAFAGVVAIVFALFLLFETGGGSVPDGAVRQEQMGYALNAPRGWTVLTKENYDELVKELGSRLPENLRSEIREGRIHMGVMKILPNQEFSPSLNVVVTEEALPSIDEEQKEQAVKALTAVYKALLKNFKVLSSEIVEIDELTSLKVSMAGLMKVKMDDGQMSMGFRQERWREFQMHFIQYIVPGNKRAYILTATSLEDQFRTYGRTFDQIVDSFRVLDRPPIFGSLITNALKVGLAAAGVYLLYFFFAGVVMWVRR